MSIFEIKIEISIVDFNLKEDAHIDVAFKPTSYVLDERLNKCRIEQLEGIRITRN